MSDLKQNMGGVIQIEFANIADILSFPAISDNECLTEIVFSEGTGWGDPINVANKSQFKNESEDTDQGILYPAVLSAVIPKYNADNKPHTHFTSHEIVKITTSNGDVLIMGSPSHPIRPSYIADTGLMAADRNSVVMSFEYKSPYPCPFYDF